jgi:hypothetical protein
LSHSYEAPTLEGPADTKQGYMPYCRVKWQWPKRENVVFKDIHYINIDIKTETKTLVGMELLFRGTNLLPTPPIKVGITPELEEDYQRRIGRKNFFDTNSVR